MPRFGVEPAIMMLSATVMAVMVVAVGHGITPTAPPPTLMSQPLGTSGEDAGACQRTVLTPRQSRAVAGAALLCVSGPAMRLTLKASGLVPGARYAIAVSTVPTAVTCDDGPCAPTSLLGDSQAGRVETVGERTATSPGDLEIADARLPGHLVTGSRISVLLQPAGTAGPDAEAVFVIP